MNQTQIKKAIVALNETIKKQEDRLRLLDESRTDFDPINDLQLIFGTEEFQQEGPLMERINNCIGRIMFKGTHFKNSVYTLYTEQNEVLQILKGFRTLLHNLGGIE